MPTVSVILTSYNHEKYISKSIESVLNQTYSDFELIVIDDFSTDNSWNIIQNYKDDRIIGIRNEKNIRSLGWHNAIKNIAKGKYIAIHHSDDIWLPDKLEKQVAFLDSNAKCAAVFTLVNIIDEDGNEFTDKEHKYYSVFNQPNRTRYEWLSYFYSKGNCLCHPSILIRKEAYEQHGLFNYGFGQIPDLLMWIRLCLVKDIYIIQEKLTKFRIRENEKNTSGDRPETQIRDSIETFKILEEYLKLTDPSEFIKVFTNASKYFINGQFISQFAFAMECLKNGSFQSYKLFGISLLFDLVNNKEMSNKLECLYNFSRMDLIKITGKYDIFSTIPMDNKYLTQMYINTGNGYSEAEKITIQAYVSHDMKFSVNFDLKLWKEENKEKEVVSLRWDPCEVKFCRCMIENVDTDGVYGGITYKNSFRQKDRWDEFFTIDPIYELNGNFTKSTYILIEGKIDLLKSNEITYMLNEVIFERSNLLLEISSNKNSIGILEESIQDKDRHIFNLENIVKEQKVQINNLENEIEEKYNYIREQEAHMNNLENEIEEKYNYIREQEAHMNNLGKEIEEKYNYIREQETHMNNLEKQIEEKCNYISELEENNKIKESNNQNLENLIIMKDQHINNIERQLNGILGSKKWKLLTSGSHLKKKIYGALKRN